MEVESVTTAPIAGQKTGTSGLRKRVKVFQEKNYLNNWLQSLFNSLQPDLEGLWFCFLFVLCANKIR